MIGLIDKENKRYLVVLVSRKEAHMSQKNVQVCDCCGKVITGTAKSIKFGETEFSEVCESCVGRIGTFVKKLGEPHVSNYAKQKAKKAAANQTEETKVEPEGEAEAAPVQEEKKTILKRR